MNAAGKIPRMLLLAAIPLSLIGCYRRTGLLRVYTIEKPVTIFLDGKDQGTFTAFGGADFFLPLGRWKVRLEFPATGYAEEHTLALEESDSAASPKELWSRYEYPWRVAAAEKQRREREQIETAKKNAENMDVTWEKMETDFPEEYLFFFGKTKEEIVEKNGGNFGLKAEEVANETGYIRYEEISYYEKGLVFEILFTPQGKNFIVKLEMHKGVEYIGDIHVGCDMSRVRETLGTPSARDPEQRQVSYIYRGDYSINFILTHDMKAERIVVRRDIRY
jgi:hypothetical protein